MAGKKMAEVKKAVIKKIQFEVSAPQAGEVFVAGDFNHWDVRATPLKKDEKGVWKAAIPLETGRHEYRFLIDGNWENDRSCSGCVPNDFGSLNCVRIVN